MMGTDVILAIFKSLHRFSAPVGAEDQILLDTSLSSYPQI